MAIIDGLPSQFEAKTFLEVRLFKELKLLQIELEEHRKEIKNAARLREALADAQGLNAGLQKDKDDAHQLVQMMLNRLPGRTFILTPRDIREYDPRRWYVARTPYPSGNIRYHLKEK